MSEYSELSREDLIALVTHYESLTDEGGLFSDFGFKSTIQFARWGSSYQSPVQVKGAKEIVEVFSGEADAEILREVGISPKSLFASIRWKK
jgi:hypothetical protein